MLQDEYGMGYRWDDRTQYDNEPIRYTIYRILLVSSFGWVPILILCLVGLLDK